MSDPSAAPPTEASLLRSSTAPDVRDASGRQGVWNTGETSSPHPEARTTYIDDQPDGPFVWPGGAGRGWLEGVLRPLLPSSAEVVPPDRRLRTQRHGTSRFELVRTFGPSGTCMREARFDAHGRAEGLVRHWDQHGTPTAIESYAAGVPNGTWGHQKGKSWITFEVVQGRVTPSPEQTAKIGELLTTTAQKYADGQKIEQVLVREVLHHDLLGRTLWALFRAGAVDPLSTPAMFATASEWVGVDLADVDALLRDPRPYPSLPALCHLPDWSSNIDRLVARVIHDRPLEDWVSLARSLTQPARRIGLLFLAKRFGARLDDAEIEEVALAMLEAESNWSMQRIAVPGPLVDELTLAPFSGSVRDAITSAFGL